MTLDLVEQLHGVELYHFVGTARGFGGFTDPSTHHRRTFGTDRKQVTGTDTKCTTTDLSRSIDNGLFDVSFNGTEHGGIDNAHQDTQGIAPVQIDIARHVLGETRRDNNDIVRIARFRHILDEQIHHATQTGIVPHEQFGDSKKDFGGFRAAQDTVPCFANATAAQ